MVGCRKIDDEREGSQQSKKGLKAWVEGRTSEAGRSWLPNRRRLVVLVVIVVERATRTARRSEVDGVLVRVDEGLDEGGLGQTLLSESDQGSLGGLLRLLGSGKGLLDGVESLDESLQKERGIGRRRSQQMEAGSGPSRDWK